MKIFYKIVFIMVTSLAIFSFGPKVEARENVTDWYIKNFDSEIVVNKDSSLTVTENILADCGNALGKHGIFRVLPLGYQKKVADGIKLIKTPVQLSSITDFNGHPYKYEEMINKQDHTISWKIGDPNAAVHGQNGYRIKYVVKNVIRFDNDSARFTNGGFDEFYWNLNGNFWQLETDKFNASILFPAEFTPENSQVSLYSGDFGSKDEGLASFGWDGKILKVNSKRTLGSGEGITISVTAPKGIFTPYTLTEQDNSLYQSGSIGPIISAAVRKVANGVGIAWPIIVLIICFFVWGRYGKDPKINRAVAPEFEIPNGLMPLEMGMVDSQGELRNSFISATIINLAVKNVLTIEVVGKTGIFSKEDYKLKTTEKNQNLMNESEKYIFGKIFGAQQEILMSSLQNSFYMNIPSIKKTAYEWLINQKLIKKSGSSLKTVMLVFAGLILFLGFFLASIVGGLGAGVIISAVIIFIFAFLMPSRTPEGAELEMRIKGFRMYMETAEKYQQQFNEKENIFEKFLPYAILFGMTKMWLDKMKNIYGAEYFNTYQPLWLHGAMMTGGHFDFDNFSNTLDSMTSSMASTIASSPSSSGSGGGGFSGGGGGGGGGGGW